MDIICIRCPIGCHLHIEKVDGNVVVTGNSCPRGAEYGKQEFVSPQRTVTTVKTTPRGTIALRTSADVPKKLYFDVLKAIKDAPLQKKYKPSDIFIKNVCDTGVDVVVTSVNEQ